MSPSYWYSNDPNSIVLYVFGFSDPGHFGYDSIHLALGVRPEISLRYW